MVDSVKLLSGFLIVGTTLFSACTSSETTPSGRVSLGLNQSARLGPDVTIRIDSIQDGRCPTGLTCIWAGEAKVKLLLSNATASTPVRLTLGRSFNASRLDSTDVTLGSTVYKVILNGVNPYPSYPPTNEPQVALVQVTKI
ncbi:hypothetical protein [Spirosoma endophyticum]|uniref:Lipoprotein n=1 Tax=Spirosoma endophyticum TaxID=662367 RepID=A0A1I1WDX5_9BACT|nr:hypothetical protein [Spirosoma endophyticum]SFD93231.1 hypothetical protein SAMN05216167_108239 [Spirosoma endophyticum]